MIRTSTRSSLSLNVRTAKGLDIAKRLIAVGIVIENFSSPALRSWGLGYDEQRRLKPDIVYVSMSGYGHTGRITTTRRSALWRRPCPD